MTLTVKYTNHSSFSAGFDCYREGEPSDIAEHLSEVERDRFLEGMAAARNWEKKPKRERLREAAGLQ